MKKLIVLLFLLTVASLFPQTMAPGGLVWFDNVKAPTKYTEEQLCGITAKLHEMLRKNASFDTFATSVKDDNMPRVIFLSIGDDLWPARTYYGTGFSFLDALSRAVEILRVNEEAKRTEIVKQATSVIEDAQKERKKVPQDWVDRRNTPGQWQWLKLQIVQAVRPYPSFTFNSSRFSFTDFVGFSFGPDLGFAFTPDQITGRYLMTPTGFLSKKQVGNIIAEAFNFEALNTWLKVTNFNEPQGICFFEMDTYFTDGINTQRLFRCHTLPTIPSAIQCINAAHRGARAIAERIATKSGELKQPFPDWEQPKPNNEAQDDMAELSIALQRVAAATGDQSLLDVASRVLWPFKKAGIAFGDTKEHFAFADIELLPENSAKQPRTFAPLRSNALALIAHLPLLAADSAKSDAKLHGQLKRIAEFIAGMRGNDGNFHNARIVPSGQTLDYHKEDIEGRMSDNALAAIALHHASTKFGVAEWKTLSKTTIAHIAKTLMEVKDGELPLDPWIVEALTLGNLTSQAHRKLMPRLAGLLMRSCLPKPYAPDVAGAPASYPSYVTSARNSWAISTLARWFKTISPMHEEALSSYNALSTSFHLQAQMNLPTASSLPRPKFYIDFFRDTLDDFRFTLAGNNAQLIALVKTAELLKEFHEGHFPDEKMAERQLARARKYIDIHPYFITMELISNTNGTSEEARSLTGAMSDVKESKVSPEESGFFQRRTDKKRK